MDDTVAIIGGTGFVGRYLISALRTGKQTREIRVLSRSEPKELPQGVVWQKANVRDPVALLNGLKGCSIVYYLPGILAETKDQKYEDVHLRGVVEMLNALSGRSVTRVIHVSAIGAAINASSAYHRTKKKAENAVMNSGIPFTIVRPSLVFGAGDKSINQFLSFGRALHILPMIGPGTARVQPVFAGDLGAMLSLIAERPDTSGKIFEIGGPRIYTYREMMETIRKSAHLKALILPAPVAVMMALGVLQKILFSKPFLTPDVIRMALSDNITQRNAPVVDFGMSLVSLESWLEAGKV